SLAISGSFDTSRCHGFDLEAYWYHALATAALSRMICRHMVSDERPDQDGVYLAGLLFDIGVLVLVHLFPDDYASVLQQSKSETHKELSQQEEDLVGISSREAGGWILDRWHLPAMVVEVVRQLGKDTTSESALVGMADLWVNHGIDEDEGITRDLLGVSSESIEIIQAEFLHQADEIRAVASLLAN
ncbi:MAG: HDOD domain-containing protein, partial [Candidatus Thiodiazotropha sp. (ex Notomyrtea botanica)]|nr:HDOD domain-containing protein [Candidatus Thiodiazotropha sp. (ex Notomyrtea botanica)]